MPHALALQLLLLSEGQLVYQGPLDGALPHFRSLGFACPDRTDLADFLVEVGAEAAAAYGS